MIFKRLRMLIKLKIKYPRDRKRMKFLKFASPLSMLAVSTTMIFTNYMLFFCVKKNNLARTAQRRLLYLLHRVFAWQILKPINDMINRRQIIPNKKVLRQKDR